MFTYILNTSATENGEKIYNEVETFFSLQAMRNHIVRFLRHKEAVSGCKPVKTDSNTFRFGRCTYSFSIIS